MWGKKQNDAQLAVVLLSLGEEMQQDFMALKSFYRELNVIRCHTGQKLCPHSVLFRGNRRRRKKRLAEAWTGRRKSAANILFYNIALDGKQLRIRLTSCNGQNENNLAPARAPPFDGSSLRPSVSHQAEADFG